MQVRVNIDDNIKGGASLVEWAKQEAGETLSRFGTQVTRVEVFLGDDNAGKTGGMDKRCQVEARPVGAEPVSVTQKGPNVDEACRGALRKMRDLLDSRIGRKQDHKGAPTIRTESGDDAG